MRNYWIACGLLGAIVCGCSEPTAPRRSEPPTAPSPATPPTEEPQAKKAAADERPASQANQVPREAAPDKKIRSADDVKKAQVGVGKRGRGYGGGLVTEPIRVRFRAEERIKFLVVDNNLKLFKAEHNRLPKSHEEFMTEIIKKGAVRLPDLPDGEEYVYDPERGELMVRRPK